MPEIEITAQVKSEIGQHFVFGFHGTVLSEDVIELVRDYHVGNIILMKRNVIDIPQVRYLVDSLQTLARDSGHTEPLMIGIDQENGLVSAFSSTTASKGGTQFPGAMALAATDSIEISEKVYAATGKEMHLAGINWAYSPVCDVNSDPRNPVIGVRSFGDVPYKVGRHAAAASRGLVSSGIASCVKHFPGHGDTHIDSHLGLPLIHKTKEELEATELIPFRRLISENVPSVMTGHMALPLVTGDDTPCSLSSVITTNLLREEMGFEGVVTTDCLEMDSIALRPGGVPAGAVQSLAAGADIVMICHRIDRQKGAIKATYEAVKQGRLSLEALRESGKRITLLKKRFAPSFENIAAISEESLLALKSQSKEISRSAYERSIALVRDPLQYIPLRSAGNTLVFTPAMERINPAVDDAESFLRTVDGKLRNTAGPSYTAFAESVSRRVATSTHVVYGPKDDVLPKELIKDRAGISAVIFATRNADRSVWQIDYLIKLLELIGSAEPRVPIIVLATSTPYDLLLNSKYSNLPVAYFASFEFTPNALESAAAVIFGETQPTAKLPVQIGGDADPTSAVSSLENPLNHVGELHSVWEAALGTTRWKLTGEKLAVLFGPSSPSVQTIIARSSSEGNIIGLAITSLNDGSDPKGGAYIGGSLIALVVHPSWQRRGVGTSLHHAALSQLQRSSVALPSLSAASTQNAQLVIGRHFPRLWPGVPTDLGQSVIDWFRRKGWAFSAGEGEVDYYRDLSAEGYTLPAEIENGAKNAGVTFARLQPEQAESLTAFENKNWTLALKEQEHSRWASCRGRFGDVSAAFNRDGSIIGLCVASYEGSFNQEFVSLSTLGKVGIIANISVDPAWNGKDIDRALLFFALECISKMGATGCFAVGLNSTGVYERAGFKQWAVYQGARRTMSRALHDVAHSK